jgi:hypothetical protein
MKGLLGIAGAMISLAVIGFILTLWYQIYFVGRYYESANILMNILVGGVPLWLAIGIFGIYKLLKSNSK